MFQLINIKRILIIVAFVAASTLAVLVPTVSVGASEIYGCDGGPAGPPSPGTVCPDGSIPLEDSTLPLGCPGSSQQGQIQAGYEVDCPSRPGRVACTFEQLTNNCTTGSGNVVYPIAAPTADDPLDEAPTYSANDCNATGGNINQGNCGIIRYLVMFINILSAIVGVVVVSSIIYGGIQYSMAGSDPSKIGEAKNRIRNALIALLFFIFGYSFLNYLVPGGVL